MKYRVYVSDLVIIILQISVFQHGQNSETREVNSMADKVSKAETDRLKKFNEQLHARKGKLPKAKK